MLPFLTTWVAPQRGQGVRKHRGAGLHLLVQQMNVSTNVQMEEATRERPEMTKGTMSSINPPTKTATTLPKAATGAFSKSGAWESPNPEKRPLYGPRPLPPRRRARKSPTAVVEVKGLTGAPPTYRRGLTRSRCSNSSGVSLASRKATTSDIRTVTSVWGSKSRYIWSTTHSVLGERL